MSPDTFVKLICSNCNRETVEFELDPPNIIKCVCGRYCMVIEFEGETLFFCCRESASLREEV